MKSIRTLLVIQLRLVAWPALFLLAGVALIFLLPDNPLGAIAMLMTIGSVALAGPILFGAEYHEGAREYLATRPASPRIVFGWKVILLAVMVVISSATFNFALDKYELSRGNYSWALLIFGTLFSFTLWSSAIAVLTRDTIRGILFGLVSFIVVVFLLAQATPYMFMTRITELPWEYTRREMLPQDELFLYGAIVLSPLAVLAILAWIHSWQIRRRSVISPTAAVAFCLYAAYLGSNVWGLHNDGEAAFLHWPGPTHVLGKSVEDGQLRYVARLPHRNMLFTLDLEDPRAEPAPVCVVGATWAREPRFMHWNAYIDGNRVLLAGSSSLGLRLYEIRNGRSVPVKLSGVRREGQRIISVQDLLKGRLAIYYQDTETTWDALEPISWAEFDMKTSNIVDIPCATAAGEPRGMIQAGSRRYRRVWSAHRFGDFAVEIDDASAPCATSPLGRIPIKVKYVLPLIAIDRNQVAMFKYTNSGWRPGKLWLYDTTDPANPSVVPVKIPWRLVGMHTLTQEALMRLGLRTLRQFKTTFISLGGGFLCLEYLQRVAVWDVHDSANPKFLGIAPSPIPWRYQMTTDANPSYGWPIDWQGSTTPIQRSDGALGYVSDYGGLLWLELPGRMGENAP